MLEKEKKLNAINKHTIFFNYAPVALWVEDFSKAKSYVDKLAKKNKVTVPEYIKVHPEIIPKLDSLIVIEDVNYTAVKMHKAKSKEDLLDNLDKIFTKESNTAFCRIFKKILEGNLEATEETINKTIEGDFINVSVKVKVVKGSEKLLDKVVVSGEDITEKVQAKQKIVTIEKTLSSTLTGIKDALVILDHNSNYTYVNKEAERLLGVSFKELKGKNIWKKFPEKRGDLFYDNYYKALQIQKPLVFENYFKPWDKWFENRIIPSKDSVIMFFQEITEKKKQENFTRYAYNIINKSQSVAFLAENKPNLPLVFASKNTKDIFGYTSEEFLNGKVALRDIMHPSYKQIAKDSLISILKGNIYEGYKTETVKIITKQGKVKWVQANLDVILDEKGNITHLQGIVSDLTELINDKLKLENSRKTYYDIFEKTYDAVFIIKGNSIVDCNQAMLDLFDYEHKSDIIGSTPIKESPEFQKNGEKSEEMAQRMINIALEKGNHRFEWLKVKKNGEIFPTEVTLTSLKDIQGEDIIHVLIRDTSEKVKKEQLEKIIFNISKASDKFDDFKVFSRFIKNELSKIIETTNFYIALYDQTKDLVNFVFNEDKNIKVKGFSPKNTLTGLVIESKKSLFVNPKKFKNLLQQKKVNLVGKPAKIWIGVPLKDKGNVFGVLAVQSYDNATAYKEEDVKLFEFVANQISESIQRKTIEDKLKEALKRARESDKLKSSFLANMSHEIRTPMNGIIGFSELLMNKNLTNQEIAKYSEIINNSGKQLLSIVNDVLDISKIEAGVVKLNLSTIDLNNIIANLYNFYLPKAKRRGLTLVAKKGLMEKESIIKTDPTKLNQILTNLLSNSFKFTSKGTISFGYTLENKHLKFFVNDTGIGIGRKHQKIVFNRFIQVGNSFGNQKGTGLGLAISKKFIELFRGEIWIEKSSPKGTSIRFTIPYIKEKAPKKQLSTAINIADIAQKNKTILIADDEMFNRLFITEIFAKNNFNIIEVENGLKAVELSRKMHIDLILMDLKMPVMGGVEAMKIIKKEKSNLPIVGISAFAMETDREEALKAGFDNYITKPVNKNILFELVGKYFKTNIS